MASRGRGRPATLAPTRLSVTLAILAALAPGIHAWASGRQLVAAVDDPTFPERHFARSRALGMTTVTAIIVAPLLAGGGYWWTIPLLLLGLIAGVFPSRRRIFGERWSFAVYFRHVVFSGIGMIGFWILLALSPAVIAGVAAIDPRLAFVAAAIIATLLIACQLHYPRFWLAMHRASPLDRADLAPRLAAILDRATCPPPTVHRFGAPGGHIMNALALPHRGRPAVAFGDAVLERLEPREIAAVFAHEVAHLEHFDAARLRRMGAVTLVLIALATALTALLVVLAPGYATWLTLGIMITIVGMLGVLASRSQANETASDLRAVELTGDPDALIDALTKLHVHLRLPRQWPHEVETSISHPSLARRIRAIRERAQVASPALRGTTVAHTPAATMRVALDESRAYWFEGLPAGTPDDLAAMREQASSYRALAYEELSELRLVPSGGGKALKARDVTGKAWMVSIRAEDVPPLHDALAIVDARLGQRRRARASGTPQLVAVAMLLALLAAGQAGVVLVPALVLLIRPGIAPLAALGAMALARIAAALASGEATHSDAMTLAGLLGMMVLATIALMLARRDERGAPVPVHSARPSLAALGATAGVLVLMIAARASRLSMPEVLASPGALALAVVLTGVAAVFVTRPEQTTRRAGVATGLAAAALMIVSLGAAQRVHGPSVRARELMAHRTSELDLGEGGYRLEISPDARHFAVQSAVGSDHGLVHDEEDLTFRWTLGSFDGTTRSIEAVDLAFVEETRVLAMRPERDSLLVGIEEVVLPSVESAHGGGWRRMLPGLTGPQLFVDQSEGRWSIVGRAETGELVAYTGFVDDAREPTERRWAPDTVWTQPMHVASDGTLIDYSMERASRGRLFSALDVLIGPSMRFAVWRRADGERVRLGTIQGVPQCRAAEGGVLCAGRGTDRAHLWGAMRDREPGPMGLLPSGYDVRSIGHGGALVAVERSGERVLIFDAASRSATRVRLHGPGGGRFLLDARSAGPVIATLEVHSEGTRIGVYRAR